MTATATTVGLVDTTAPASTLQQIQWAVAAGTGDAITAAYPTAVAALSDGLALSFRALAANTIVNPTFAPDELTPYPIKKQNLQALGIGDIAGNGHEIMVRFNDANKCWLWVNR